MKKLFFTAIAIIAFSGFAMANSSEKNISLVKEQMNSTETVTMEFVSLVDYPFTVCYEVRRTSFQDDSGVIVVTVTYRCVTINV